MRIMWLKGNFICTRRHPATLSIELASQTFQWLLKIGADVEARLGDHTVSENMLDVGYEENMTDSRL